MSRWSKQGIHRAGSHMASWPRVHATCKRELRKGLDGATSRWRAGAWRATNGSLDRRANMKSRALACVLRAVCPFRRGLSAEDSTKWHTSPTRRSSNGPAGRRQWRQRRACHAKNAVLLPPIRQTHEDACLQSTKVHNTILDCFPGPPSWGLGHVESSSDEVIHTASPT